MISIEYSQLKKEAEEYLKWTEKNLPPSFKWHKFNDWRQWNKIAKEGAGSETRFPFTHYGSTMPVYLSLIRYLNRIKIKKGMKLIELGCGTGRGVSYIKVNFPKLEVHGVDYCKESIEHGKKFYSKTGTIFNQVKAQGTHLPDSSFNFVISSHVIEHLTKKEGKKFMEEIYRLLKEGGYAFVGTPNRKQGQDFYAQNPKDDKKYRLNPAHEHEYTFVEFNDLGLGVFGKNLKIDLIKSQPFNKLFISGIKKASGKLLNPPYRLLRDFLPKNLFDGINKIGLASTMKLNNISYSDLLLNSFIKREKDIDRNKADTFLLVCHRPKARLLQNPQ
ncbi:MAG: class I SAM-dependent methyltransferase [Nanoarchaeota archaeon]|nr:class I SAM-dependent methyltransferase [Nanoarchaeota archaeon]MBU1103111.1 class I SAM-dependent methyltransferase [Nanoarchaeota archaeon]